MSRFVDTNVEPLVSLKNSLETFRDQTECMRMLTEAELNKFEQKVISYIARMEANEEWQMDSEQFYALWNRYQSDRQIFEAHIDCLLRHEMVQSGGNRNLYTLISVLEEYLNQLP